MEEQRKHDVHEPANDDKGTWVIVTAGTARFIGRVHALDFKDSDSAFDKKEFPVADVVRASDIAFKPTLDYFAPIKPRLITGPDNKPIMENGAPKTGYSRDPVVVSRDFSSHPQVTHLKNGPGVIFDFFSQMHPDDKKVYMSFIEDAMMEASKRAAAERELETGPRIVPPTGEQVKAVSRTHGRH
jgi:hypothetical protein